MPPPYVILRKQRAVGHGFFHEGTLRSRQTDAPFRWLYDCGGGKRIKSEVREYLGETKNAHVDLLFISHLHTDHVSGLPELLKYAKVRHVVLPHLTEIEKVLILARAVVDTTVRPWFVEFLRDPRQWLAANGVDRVTEVIRGGERPDDAGAIDPNRPPADGEFRVTLHDRTGRQVPEDNTTVTDDHSVVAADRCVMLRFWLYVRAAEIDEINKLGENLIGTEPLKSISTREGLRALRQAYEAVWSDINWSSLCVACIPEYSSDRNCRIFETEFHQHRSYRGILHPGWLGLGDAVLKKTADVELLKSHFGSVLEWIGTYSLPHHGSDDNFCEDLLHLGPHPRWRTPQIARECAGVFHEAEEKTAAGSAGATVVLA